jgi:threonine dehydrogenase-like Zn-dependent dehydrogenase
MAPTQAGDTRAEGRGVDASIEALGTQATFESALRVLKPGGTLSSLGVYASDLTIPMNAFAVGLGVLVTHQFKLDDIVAAYELFANQRDGVLKVAIKP